jgi:hypothetical protein
MATETTQKTAYEIELDSPVHLIQAFSDNKQKWYQAIRVTLPGGYTKLIFLTAPEMFMVQSQLDSDKK